MIFDELVVKGEQAAIRGAVCVITRCAVTLISSNLMTPHQQLAALKLASLPLTAWLE